jgi:hypothetical protein
MTPGSSFLAGLNSRAETHFRRYAIRSEIDKGWVTARVFCDLKHPMRGDGVPGGRRCARDAARTATRLKWRAGLSGLLSIGALFTGPGAIFAPGLAYAAAKDGVKLAVAYSVEHAWKTIWGYPSDGIVPMASQNWLGLSSQNTRLIRNADSHVGSTHSGLVATVLRDFLNAEWTR